MIRNGHIVFVFAFAASTLAITVTTRANAFGGAARDLGRQGNFVVTNDASFSVSQPLSYASGPAFRLQPALDYFVIPNLSVGGTLVFGYDSGNKATTVGVGGRVGYEIVLSDTWSFWPRAALTVTSVSVAAPNGAAARSLRSISLRPFWCTRPSTSSLAWGPAFTRISPATIPR